MHKKIRSLTKCCVTQINPANIQKKGHIERFNFKACLSVCSLRRIEIKDVSAFFFFANTKIISQIQANTAGI